MKLKLSPALIKFAYKFFDVEASAETAVVDGRMLEYAYVIQKLISLPKGRVLDVGCTARMNYVPAVLTSLGWEVWGIDFREFKFKHPNFKLILEDIRHTSFSDNFFDAVYAVSTIEHIGLSGRYGLSKEDLDGDCQAIKEISRITRKDGVFLCTIPWGKAKIIKPLQRVYDKNDLERLFECCQRIETVYYSQGTDGYWTMLPEESAIKIENADGNSSAALLDLKIRK
jgi:SAM-dependent methyltransferase